MSTAVGPRFSSGRPLTHATATAEQSPTASAAVGVQTQGAGKTAAGAAQAQAQRGQAVIPSMSSIQLSNVDAVPVPIVEWFELGHFIKERESQL